MASRSRIFNRTFLFKVASVIVGVFDLGLVARIYYPIFTEQPFIAMVSIAFILSFLYLIGYLFQVIPESDTIKRLDIVYNFGVFLALFMTGSVFLFSVIKLGCDFNNCSSFLAMRYIGAFMGLFNAFLYAYVGWTMLDVKIVSRSNV